MTAEHKDLFTGRWRTEPLERRLESGLQIQLVTLLRWAVRPDVLWRHIPNGEHRDPRTAAKLKAMGVLPGSADLEFHWCEGVEGGGKVRRLLHLELKIGNRKPTDSQVGFALAVRLMGDEYHVARSVDEAIAILGERGLLRGDREIAGKRWQPKNPCDVRSPI